MRVPEGEGCEKGFYRLEGWGERGFFFFFFWMIVEFYLCSATVLRSCSNDE